MSEPWVGWLAAGLVTMVPGIYLFRLHDRLLLRCPGRRQTFRVFGLLSLIGVGVAVANRLDRFSMGIAVALGSPLALGLAFRWAHAYFVRNLRRAPRDVFLNWQGGFAADRVFAIVFSLACIYLSMAAVAFFHWGLARATGTG